MRWARYVAIAVAIVVAAFVGLALWFDAGSSNQPVGSAMPDAMATAPPPAADNSVIPPGLPPIDPEKQATVVEAPALGSSPDPTASASLPFCEPIDDLATPAECARISAYKANLKTGTAAFNAPSRMRRGETVRLRLVIDKAAGSTAPAAAVDALPGDTRSFATRVGRYMRAELSGDGFKIDPLDSDPSLDLYAASQAQWEWDVTAVAGGDHVLTLRTFVQVVDSAGKKQPIGEIVTENRAVHVEVDAAGKSSDLIDDTIVWFGKGTNLLKALATLLGAALAAWLAFRKFGGGAKP